MIAKMLINTIKAGVRCVIKEPIRYTPKNFYSIHFEKNIYDCAVRPIIKLRKMRDTTIIKSQIFVDKINDCPLAEPILQYGDDILKYFC